MPSPSPSFSSSLTQRLKLRFSFLQAAAVFISVLKSLFSRVFFFFSPSMDDLFAEEDFFSTADGDDFEPLFLRRLRRPEDELPPAEDRLYFVPYRWWENAKESYRCPDMVRADLYESSSSWSDSWDSSSAGGSDLEREVTFCIARKEMDDSTGRVEHPSCKYALLPETLWFQALKWHIDYRTANKDLGCSLAAEGDTWDIFPVQTRLYVAWETSSIMVKISQTANVLQNYKRAYEIFGPKRGTIQIWDFSGQIANLLKVGRVVPQDHVSPTYEEVLLELHFYGFSSADHIKVNGSVRKEVRSSSLSVSRGGGHGEVGFLGLTGLVNLGNTCFMNSAIQCLVHTPKLVDCFLGDYRKEINYCNPLGLNGQLALAFGDLLRMLWRPGGTPVAPWAFKSTLACFAPQFSGYNQHDSQEFLAFLLDGLHEDLNRVKDKPYREVGDVDERPDYEVADEYWQNHLARNDSIIVDLFQGQYRSMLTCPNCKHVSLTFDPFMYLSLPLPSTTMRTMTVIVLSNDGISPPCELSVTVPQFGSCKDLIQALSKACCLGNNENLILAEVYNSCIIQILDDPTGSLSLIRDSDSLVAYRLPKEIEGGQVVVFMHHCEGSSHLNGALRKEAKTFGIPLVTVLSNISTGTQIREEFLKLVRPFRLREDNFGPFDDLENSDIGDAKMEEARLFSDDDSVTDDEDAVQSQSGGDFQFHEIDEQGIFKGIEMKRPLFISGTAKSLEVLVSWPNCMVPKYDTRRLSSLPVVFQHGVSSKSPLESVSLDKCLEAFLKEEPLGPEDMWYCPRCMEHRQASKKLDLWRLPEVLVIHLKRFSYSRFLKTKLETLVDFPINKLDIGGFIGHKNSSVSNTYKLFAISNHYGGMGGGHYTALVLNAGQWIEFDDNFVTLASESSVKTSSAYVLFYQRVSADS